MGFITREELLSLVGRLEQSVYGQYLAAIAMEEPA
jgi:hypothetical protein